MKSRIIALALLAVMLVAPFTTAVAPGYSDTTVTLKGKGREPIFTEFNGKLYNFYQYRTDLFDANKTMWGRRADIYYSVLNGTNWTNPVTLIPNSRDEGGHGAHHPHTAVYKDKLYVTMEAVEPTIKDDPQGGLDYDIGLRVFDGTDWNPPLASPVGILSQWNDNNISDQECRPIVFKDRLYVIWEQVLAGPDGNHTAGGFRQLVYRSFDGNAWGPISVASCDNQSVYSNPCPVVFNDRLYVSFISNTSEAFDNDVLAISFDGTIWSYPVRVNPAVANHPQKRQCLNSRIEVFANKLWCVYQTADTIAKDGTDYDILISYLDPAGAWAPSLLMNPSGDTGQDITPELKSLDGKLYVTWSCDDPGVTDGQASADIVMRSFDGTNWSAIELVSPWGDNGTIGGDHNPGDDNTPVLGTFGHRLYCTWITYDQGTGHKGGNPSVMVRLVRDCDTDGDGVVDGKDAFPNDPRETTDTDGDGVGDKSDPRPFDNTVWLKSQLPADTANPVPWAPLMVIIILLVLVGAIVAVAATKKPGAPSKDEAE